MEDRTIPFAGYADFAACVAANADKADPKAYCATLEAEATKAVAVDAMKRFTIAKIDAPQRLVFGWASVSLTKDGTPLEDLQGDVIEPAELETAAYDFVLHSRNIDEMHRTSVRGKMVESLVLTDEKLGAMGLANAGSPRVAWWTGWKLEPETFAKVEAGQYKMLSIECTATRVEV